jgi:hypothetical protein
MRKLVSSFGLGPVIALAVCALLLLLGDGATRLYLTIPGLVGALTLAFFLTRHGVSLGEGASFYPSMPSSRKEWVGLALVLSLGAFFRLYRLSELPPGLFLDMGFDGWGALRVLYEGWLPGPNLDGPNPESTLLLYALAAWFAIAPATLFGNALFFALVSIATLGIFYLVFRMLGGPRAALLGVACLAFMRWHVTYGRNAFPNSFSLLFVGLCLLFFLKAVATRRMGWFLALGAALGAGLWTYQAFKIVPVYLLALGVYEYWKAPSATRVRGSHWVWTAVVTFLVASPVLWSWFSRGSVGRREAALTIFQKVGEPGAWSFLGSHLLSYLGMFHVVGDPSPQHNIPYAPMLDPVTGVLALVGLAGLLRHFRARSSFYALSGLLFLALPGFLSVDGAHASRVLGMAPFLAWAMGWGFWTLWERAGKDAGTGGLPSGRPLLLVLALAAVFLNFHQYFSRWAKEPWVWKDHSVAETRAAQEAMRTPQGVELRVAARFASHFTFKFLAYRLLDSIEVAQADSFLNPPADETKGMRLILDPAQERHQQALKKRFSRLQETVLRYPWGEPIVLIEDIPPGSWRGFLSPQEGFKTSFFLVNEEGRRVYWERQDPFIEYANGNDFPPQPRKESGDRVGVWSGRFVVEQPGTYEMIVRSLDPVGLRVDSGSWEEYQGENRVTKRLSPGRHKIELRYAIRPVWRNHLFFRLMRSVKNAEGEDVAITPAN